MYGSSVTSQHEFLCSTNVTRLMVGKLLDALTLLYVFLMSSDSMLNRMWSRHFWMSTPGAAPDPAACTFSNTHCAQFPLLNSCNISVANGSISRRRTDLPCSHAGANYLWRKMCTILCRLCFPLEKKLNYLNIDYRLAFFFLGIGTASNVDGSIGLMSIRNRSE